MAVGQRGLIALTVVVAMLSVARPAALAMDLATSDAAAAAADAGGRTADAPTREQPVPRFIGAITPVCEEDDSDRFGPGPYFAVLISSTFEPPLRLPIGDLADLLRLVIARGWRALPRGRGPPAA